MGHSFGRINTKRLIAVPAMGLVLGLGSLGVVAGSATAATTTCTTAAYGAADVCSTPSTGSNKALSSNDGSPTTTVAAAASNSSLAFTGTDVAMTASVGAGAIAVGGIFVLGSRRRRAQS